MIAVEFLAFRAAKGEAIPAITGDSFKVTRQVKSMADSDFNPVKAEVERSFNAYVTGWRVINPTAEVAASALLASLIDVKAMLEHYRSGRPNNWDGSTKGQTLATLTEAAKAIEMAEAAGIKVTP